MKFFFSLFLFALFLPVGAQQYEYVYRNRSDSSVNCYLKCFPSTDGILGLVVRDYTELPDTVSKSRFRDLCSEAGFLTLYVVSSKTFPELFCSDSTVALLDDMVAEVVALHRIPKEKIFAGGMSASGTRALRYAQYCAGGKSRHGTKIRGVFAVDSPLDLARFYESSHRHKNHFKAGMLWEANYMHSEIFPKLFSGSPSEYPLQYLEASVFSHTDSLGGNARFLKNQDIILFHEPDIDWWLNERGAGYFDINSYDIVAFVIKLKHLGNDNVELVTTTGKGFDAEGNRKCHSWSIVDEEMLLTWMLERLHP